MKFSTLLLSSALAIAPLPLLAADWTFDKSHTSVLFTVGHLGFSDTTGIFREFDGDVTFDPADIAATEVSFTVDAASIDTFWAARDEHIRSADFLDVENHPQITFVSTAVEQTGDDTATVTGDLTIRGVTQPVELAAVLNKLDANPFNPQVQVAGFTLTGEIDRTAFGIDYGAPVIGTVMPLTINVELNAANTDGS